MLPLKVVERGFAELDAVPVAGWILADGHDSREMRTLGVSHGAA